MASTARRIRIEADPAICGVDHYMVTLPRKQLVRMTPYRGPAVPTTLGEEVEAAMRAYYEAEGRPFPEEEVDIAARIDAAEAAEAAKFDVMYAEAQKQAMAAVKPEYGTPAFWAWARARRAEKNAALVAEGKPPLPTKKEAEAAKAARKAEREAKAALKVKIATATAALAKMGI